MSAADRPSEYLKRTCLICGCNTNQTINIYEPRSGPNIVELIQAKFKFQPLNEDKYLCFSCNNWLINWHSLQANNSNDAESPSGTFRSSQVNGGMAHEKRATAQHQKHSQLQQQLQLQQPHSQEEKEESSSSSTDAAQEMATTICRPIATVKPRQFELDSDTLESIITEEEFPHTNLSGLTRKFAKRISQRNHYRLQRFGIKQLNVCCICERPIVVFVRRPIGSLKTLRRPKIQNAKCRKCRVVCKWRSIYLRSSAKAQIKRKSTRASQTVSAATQTPSLQSTLSSISTSPSTPVPPICLVNHTRSSEFSTQTYQSQNFSLKRPLVDGKVVAMLRRLGTTLSRDCTVNKELPPIMSPTKPKPRWTRPLADDEILLSFETAISEVLPIVDVEQSSTADINTTTDKLSPTRRKLTYQISCETETETETEAQNQSTNYQSILNSLPKGLNVSLI